jgi:hypothetical protein
MRFLLKVIMDVEAGNRLAKAGKLGTTIQSILTDLKPEAAYFLDTNGQRSGLLFLDMQDASQIPAIAQPWFLALNASIEIHPGWSQGIWPRLAVPSRQPPRSTADNSSATSQMVVPTGIDLRGACPRVCRADTSLPGPRGQAFGLALAAAQIMLLTGMLRYHPPGSAARAFAGSIIRWRFLAIYSQISC